MVECWQVGSMLRSDYVINWGWGGYNKTTLRHLINYAPVNFILGYWLDQVGESEE